MSDQYDPQAWANEEEGGTPLSAARLAHMETGIDDVDEALQDEAAARADQDTAHDQAISDVVDLVDEVATGKQDSGDYVVSTDITIIDVVTQAAYDALSPPVATTLYVIVG